MFLRRATLILPKSRRLFSSSSSHDLVSSIAELNKEMEFVFGEAPPTSLAGSGESQPMGQESEFKAVKKVESESKLTHISVKGEAQMVDVSHKDISKRVAIASCKVILGKKVYDLVSANQVAKGDVLSVAKIAGITGAKQTSNLIPLCHNINLTHVRVDLKLNPNDYCVEIEGEAASTGKTGVEMEAMTAVSLAGLTVYDMCKAASKDIQITDVRLDHKTGGKSGTWSREK
uniref:cyclic pyranopterin monophosphate synthase, mitochondrial n=1 Tax=Erigeron canadensis TaxID=72917 RepID=UPI001CB8FF2D|nr:cyclic pyranopterin monophosphate synthase, mitochondrial [Erigeron canadensis]